MAAAAATSTFCSTSHSYGVEKLNGYLRHSSRNINRIYQALSPDQDVSKRPSCSKISFNKRSIRQVHSLCMSHGLLLKCRPEHTDTHIQGEEGESISKATLVWRAIKLPIYTVALIPITVGSAAAYFETGQYVGKRYLMLLVSSVLIITWLNLSNDIYDFDAGADKNKKESVVKLLGSRTGTLVFAWLLLAPGFTGLTWISIEAGSLRPLYLLACAITCGYIYQCPPFRLSYIGLGEPLCFAAFGPFATTAFYLLQRGTRELSASSTVLSSSILVGFTTTLILFCSHFHQIDDDKAVGKISPLVRLGTEAGAKVVKVAVTALYLLVFVLGLGQTLPFSSVVLCALTLPIGNLVSSFVENNHKDKAKIFMAKYYCVRLHTVFGAALAAGLVGARMFARRQLPHAIIIS